MSAPGTKQKFPNNVSWHMPSFLRGDYRSICRLCLSNIASGVSSQCIQSSSQITQSLLFLDSLMVSRHSLSQIKPELLLGVYAFPSIKDTVSMKTDRESTIRRSEPDLTLILAISDGQFSNTSDNHLPH
ncbi:Uncharacterised protein [Kluyvera cryocrescens]|uniref:Uncharacterized protein n=1 Tax=Kluyvera cryocrescens TaxID=580 RepID=A0A485AU74_KLUCR|nr:Uncharacterised protein [Kluyvera cryocrescens]